MKCTNCSSPMSKTITRYHYKECGLRNVHLDGVALWKCHECGEEELEIHEIEMLHHIIATFLAEKTTRLKPEEIRFMRVHLGFSGSDFARAISVKPETVSRWENDPKHEMNLSNEKLLRLMILAKLGPFTDYQKLQEFGKDSSKTSKRMSFQTTTSGWKSSAA